MSPGVEEEVHPAVVTVGLKEIWTGIDRNGPRVRVSEEGGAVRMDAARVRRILSVEV